MTVVDVEFNFFLKMKRTEHLYQRQLATTFAAILGFNFKPVQPVMPPIKSILGR